MSDLTDEELDEAAEASDVTADTIERLITEIRRHRAARGALLSGKDRDALRHFRQTDGHTLCTACVKARDVLDKLLAAGKVT